MARLIGTCRPLCTVSAGPLAQWALEGLPDWPQRERMTAESPYPAMVSDPEWRGFGERTKPLVESVMAFFPGHVAGHRMLSVLMPGQSVFRHDDVQGAGWRARIQIPIVSNPESTAIFDDAECHLEPGTAYLFNCEVPHALRNAGATPRIHFFFDAFAA